MGIVGHVWNLLTKADNETLDEIKVGGFIILASTSVAILSASVACFYLAFVTSQFEVNSYFMGLAAVIAACGALLPAMGVGMGARDKMTPKE